MESIQAEDESAKLCKRRIEHLKEHSSEQPAAAGVWKRKRMDRMMVEHLLRCGYYSTAVKLARQSGIEVGPGTSHRTGHVRPMPVRLTAGWAVGTGRLGDMGQVPLCACVRPWGLGSRELGCW